MAPPVTVIPAVLVMIPTAVGVTTKLMVVLEFTSKKPRGQVRVGVM